VRSPALRPAQEATPALTDRPVASPHNDAAADLPSKPEPDEEAGAACPCTSQAGRAL
jgi:hypothetical protein